MALLLVVLVAACVSVDRDRSDASETIRAPDVWRQAGPASSVAYVGSLSVPDEVEFKMREYSGGGPVSGAGASVWTADSGISGSLARDGLAGSAVAGASGEDRFECVRLGGTGAALSAVVGDIRCPARSSASDDGAATGAAEDSISSAPDSVGVMLVRRAVAVSGCAALFNSPGEQLNLVAAGFAGGATVSLTGHAASLGDTALSAPALADVTADADGVVEVMWSVPRATAASVDSAPRGYAVVASGANPAGGTHMARLLAPV